MPSIPADRFYAHVPPSAAPAPHDKEPFLLRNGRSDTRVGLWLFLAGFVTVFLSQAPLLYQVILGAPIFEEFLKAGLTLLLVAWWTRGLAGLPVRLVVGFAVGAGFGALEHYASYGDEAEAMVYFRGAFHGLSTSLSMLTLHALRASPRPAVRWLATAPSSAVHYFHNTMAVLLGIGGFLAGNDSEGPAIVLLFLSPALLVAGHLTVPASAARLRAAAEGWAERHLGAAGRADPPAAPKAAAAAAAAAAPPAGWGAAPPAASRPPQAAARPPGASPPPARPGPRGPAGPPGRPPT